MPSRRIWTEDVLQQTFRLLCDGYDYGEIAEMYGVTRCAVRTRMSHSWVGKAYRERSGKAKSTAIRFWTKTRREELARLYRLELPLKEMAATLGCTVLAIRHQAQDMGLSNRERGSRITAAQRVGKRHSSGSIKIMKAKAKSCWQRPDYVAKQESRGGIKAHMTRIGKIGNDNKRGFIVPADLEADYRLLVCTKGISSAEAGTMLGIIPARAAQ